MSQHDDNAPDTASVHMSHGALELEVAAHWPNGKPAVVVSGIAGHYPVLHVDLTPQAASRLIRDLSDAIAELEARAVSQ